MPLYTWKDPDDPGAVRKLLYRAQWGGLAAHVDCCCGEPPEPGPCYVCNICLSVYVQITIGSQQLAAVGGLIHDHHSCYNKEGGGQITMYLATPAYGATAHYVVISVLWVKGYCYIRARVHNSTTGDDYYSAGAKQTTVPATCDISPAYSLTVNLQSGKPICSHLSGAGYGWEYKVENIPPMTTCTGPTEAYCQANAGRTLWSADTAEWSVEIQPWPGDCKYRVVVQCKLSLETEVYYMTLPSCGGPEGSYDNGVSVIATGAEP